MSEKREWTDEEVYRLIELYEEKEFLWNVKNKLYRNREKKIEVYEQFASKFANCSSNEIQRKIHNLRNQVSHELQKIKKIKSGDGADDKYESKWKFFSALQFIIPNFQHTTSTSNMNNSENINISQDESIQNKPTQAQKRKRNSQATSKPQEDNNILKEVIEIMKKPKDDFDRFGEYVALELKSLKSDYYRGVLKSEIRKAILNISDMDEKKYWFTASGSSSSTPIASPPIVVDNFSQQNIETQTTRDFYKCSLSLINKP